MSRSEGTRLEVVYLLHPKVVLFASFRGGFTCFVRSLFYLLRLDLVLLALSEGGFTCSSGGSFTYSSGGGFICSSRGSLTCLSGGGFICSSGVHSPSSSRVRSSSLSGVGLSSSSGVGLSSSSGVVGAFDRKWFQFSKDTKLETLIATYDIPLDLRPRLPDPIFRMITLPAEDTAIEEVLVHSGLSRVWRNLMCDPVLRRSDNTVMSIHDFLCMPSLDKATIREEPRRLDTSILGRVADRTTSPAPAGTAIPHASLEEIVVTRPNPKVVTKADHGAKRKPLLGRRYPPMQPRRPDRVRKCLEKFAMEDIGNLNDVSQCEHINVILLRTFDPSLGLDVTYPLILLPDKEVKAHVKLSGGVRRATRASFHASHCVSKDASSPSQEAMPALDTQPLDADADADAGADEIASDGNVDPYYEAQVSNTARDVLERDLLPFVSGPYYIPYPYGEGFGSESPPYTRDDWEEIHRVNLGLQRKELYKDPKTQTIKKQRADLKQQGESTIHANEEVSRLKAKMGALKSKCEATEQKLSSWDKKHRKYRNERDALALKKEKIKEELSDFTPLVKKFLKSGEFNQAFAGVLNTAISVRVEHGLCMDRTDEEFRGLTQKVSGFIPDAKEKFYRVIAAFPNTIFPFLDKPSSATASLRANTHVRHSTSSSGTFGHTSTLENLKKKKKSVEKGGPSAA
ncbi:hypothetical protein Tco_1085524 [Tanacetum coccineum]